ADRAGARRIAVAADTAEGRADMASSVKHKWHSVAGNWPCLNCGVFDDDVAVSRDGHPSSHAATGPDVRPACLRTGGRNEPRMKHRSNTDQSQPEEGGTGRGRSARTSCCLLFIIRVPSVFHPWLISSGRSEEPRGRGPRH